MLPRENFNNGAPYDILDASLQGVLRILFQGAGCQINFRKWGYLLSAKLHATRGKATRLLGGIGGMLPREDFKKRCNLVRFGVYFAAILSKKISKNVHFLYKNYRYCINAQYI